ncbi:hypothetical protein ACWEO2_15325 [Nocardia sp. NPDC004278]
MFEMRKALPVSYLGIVVLTNLIPKFLSLGLSGLTGLHGLY